MQEPPIMMQINLKTENKVILNHYHMEEGQEDETEAHSIDQSPDN